MTEPDEIEFHERVTVSPRPDAPSMPVRIGMAAGVAVLVVVGAVAAMGASPAATSTGGLAELSEAVVPQGGTTIVPFAGEPAGRFRFGGFHDITITAISGSNLSLATDDGWTRTITLGSSATITKGGQTIAIGDLAVGDQIRFRQERQDDGSYTITAIAVVLPRLGGEVTAISGNTITVTGRAGTTGTIHVDGDTTYRVGTATGQLSDITVGDFVFAEGTLRSDGSLDADAVHSGFRGLRDGRGPGHMFRDKLPEPGATPTPTSTTS